MAAPSGPGGGGGGPVGFANPTGLGSGLNYVGNFAYGYCGNIASGSSGAEGTAFLFVTGNSLFKGHVQFCYPTDATENMTYRIYFNDEVIQQWVSTGSLEPHQPQNPVYIIIPSFTTVKITCSSAGSARGQTGAITGRVYK